jgi:hypothetical protein
MRRNGFSLRLPSCIRPDNLEESILICRAFNRQQLSIFADSGDVKYAIGPLNPQYGRFILKYRFNGDEVPYRFGRVKSVVSVVGEAATHVIYPPGWEARLATIFLIMDANGNIVVFVLIFLGAFNSTTVKRLQELESLRLKAPHIRIVFQKKGWMDGAVLAEITKKHFLPQLKDLWEADSKPFVESYLQLDNGPGRCDENFLKYLKEDCKTFLHKSPPEKTNYIQMIDDNCGRIIRDLACDYIEEVIGEKEEAALKDLSLIQRREVMTIAAEKAYLKWMDPENDHYRQIGRRAALRTGLGMRIDDNCAGVRPVRFSEDYHTTIPASSGAPVRSYSTPQPQPARAVTVTVELNSSNSIRIANEDNAMILTMEPTAQVTLTRTPLQPPTAEMAEVGQYDGYSDEEERVFLATEVADPDESSSDEDEGPRRQRRRVRWCLFGCECERQRGRKCNCERTGNQFCDKKCGCDPALCRARAPVESDEDNGGDD